MRRPKKKREVRPLWIQTSFKVWFWRSCDYCDHEIRGEKMWYKWSLYGLEGERDWMCESCYIGHNPGLPPGYCTCDGSQDCGPWCVGRQATS